MNQPNSGTRQVNRSSESLKSNETCLVCFMFFSLREERVPYKNGNRHTRCKPKDEKTQAGSS